MIVSGQLTVVGDVVTVVGVKFSKKNAFVLL